MTKKTDNERDIPQRDAMSSPEMKSEVPPKTNESKVEQQG
jgi:hypothetical protein